MGVYIKDILLLSLVYINIFGLYRPTTPKRMR